MHLNKQGVSQEREQYGRLVELTKVRDAQNALQHQGAQEVAADSSGKDPIVLDDALATPTPRTPQPYQTPHPDEQAHTAGQRPQRLQDQPHQAKFPAASSQQWRPPRFAPDNTAASGFNPGFRASPSARPANTAAFGMSPKAISQHRSTQLGASLRSARQVPSADPQSRLLDELMEELSVHQPYDPKAPLEPALSAQQSGASSSTQIDLDEVIAR